MKQAQLRSRLPGPRVVLAAGAALALAALVVAGLLRVHVETGVEEFVPRDDPFVRSTSQVAERFGGDPVVVLLESAKPHGLLAKDQLPALLRLEGELAALPDVAAVYGPGTVLNQIAGQAQDLLAELAGYRDGLRSRAEAGARKAGLSAAAVARAGKQATRTFDERYAALLGQGMPGGLPTLHNQAFVDRVIFNDEGDPRPRWDFLVPRSDAVAILVRPDASLRQSETERLVAAIDRTVDQSDLAVEDATVTGIPAVVAALGEQIRHEIPLLGGIAILAVGAWFLLTGWTRRRYRLLPLAATLVGTSCTLALAGWVGHPLALTAVAFLPVLLGIGSDFMTYLHRGVGTRTVLAAALASAAGFCALVVAPVPAVADLGLTLAVGLVVTVTASLVLQRWLPVATDQDASAPSSPTRPAVSRRVRVGLVGAVVLASAAGWALLPTLSMQSDFRSLASNLDEYDDAQRIERVMGASGEVVVALRGDDVLNRETLQWMGEARRDVITRHGDALKPVISPPEVLDFLGSRPTDAQVAAALRLVPSYLSASVVTPERDMAIMTFGVDLDDVGELRELRDYLGELAAGAPGSVDVELAGLPMVAVSADQALQEDRLLTALLGVLAAGAVLLLLLRRRSVALLAMVSAASASGLVMLGMAVTGLALTPMTAGLGSLTAAVACEFTVVLAHAQRVADRRIRRAVDLAAAASATGYSVLAFSDLGLIRGFGLVLAMTVVVALAVSRLLVWAVLARRPRDLSENETTVERFEEPRTLEVVG
jgi:uncharacterized protein